MNTDRIETQGEATEPTVMELLQATAKTGWDKIKAEFERGVEFQYSISIGMRVEARGAIPTLEKLFAKMVEGRRIHNVQIVDREWIYDINAIEHLKAMVFKEPIEIELVTRKERDTVETGEQEESPTKSEWDGLEDMGKLIRTMPSDKQIRGKSGMLQALTLQALHHAFDTGRERPYAQRSFRGNNAATTLLGNIGRRKVGGKK